MSPGTPKSRRTSKTSKTSKTASSKKPWNPFRSSNLATPIDSPESKALHEEIEALRERLNRASKLDKFKGSDSDSDSDTDSDSDSDTDSDIATPVHMGMGNPDTHTVDSPIVKLPCPIVKSKKSTKSRKSTKSKKQLAMEAQLRYLLSGNQCDSFESNGGTTPGLYPESSRGLYLEPNGGLKPEPSKGLKPEPSKGLYPGLCEPSVISRYWEKGQGGRVPSGRLLRAWRKDLFDLLAESSPESLGLLSGEYPGVWCNEGEAEGEAGGILKTGNWSSGFLRGLVLGGALCRMGDRKLSARHRMHLGSGFFRRLLVEGLRDLVSRYGGTVTLYARHLDVSGCPLLLAKANGEDGANGANGANGEDVMAGLLVSGSIRRVKTGLGSNPEYTDRVCDISGREEVTSLLDAWGIYRSVVFVGIGGLGRVRVGLFWPVLFADLMPDIIRDGLLSMGGVKPSGMMPMHEGLNGRLSLLYWSLALGIRWKLPMFSGVLPFCPSRMTIWKRYGSGYGDGLHQMGLEMGLPVVSGGLHEVIMGYFLSRCDERGLVAGDTGVIKEFPLVKG